MALSSLAFGCTLVVERDVKGSGLGIACESNDACHAGQCDQGICVAPCTVEPDCPAPTKCLANKCQKPLKVATLWVGVVSGGEGWTYTHQEGMEEAAKKLSYLDWVPYKKESVVLDKDIADAVDDAVVNKDVDVVVTNSYSQRNKMLEMAKKYPQKKFLNCLGWTSNGTNAGAFAAHEEQAWWVAGRVAGSKAQRRIGYIGSLITPEVVRHITAFFLGAKSVNPNIRLEVQWLGFWFDYNQTGKYTYNGPLSKGTDVGGLYREELLTYRLIDNGAEVIAHGADNQRSVRLIEKLTKDGKIKDADHPNRQVWSISNDNRNGYRQLTAEFKPEGDPLETCLGSPFWNWSPLYVSLFDEIHRGKWTPSNRNEVMSTDVANSVPGFNLNPIVNIDDSSVRQYVTEISQKGWQYVFNGYYETTGQRDVKFGPQAFGDGEKMSDQEYQSMCWFPKGIVEKSDPKDPNAMNTPDRDARVPDPARATDTKFLDDILGPPGADRGKGINCNENQ